MFSSLTKRLLVLRSVRIRHFVSYIQGQTPFGPKTREYFYYIDHQGQLFLDNTKVKNFITCFKDKKFLDFFFKRLKINDTGRYHDDFPYVSPCGPELNFIRCDDQPIVFHQLLMPNREIINDIHSHSQLTTPTALLAYGGVSTLTVPFTPQKLVMFPESGRVYHSGPVGGVGLVKSSLAIELSRYFYYKDGERAEDNAPVGFSWQGTDYTLDNTVLEYLNTK